MSTIQATRRPLMTSYATATNVLVADNSAPWEETGITATAAYRPRKLAQRPRSERNLSGLLSRSVLLTAGSVMPLHPSEDALAAAESYTSATPRPLPNFSEADRENLANTEERPRRGVFAIEHGDEVLFTKRIDMTACDLDEWKPDPIVSRGRLDDGDE